MREVMAVCRSTKKAREEVASILDRYFWRYGDQTWRGRASNECLDRVSRELRARATKNTAVTIQEVRTAHESRMPLIRIGSKKAFSREGLAPVASHPADYIRASMPGKDSHALSVVCIAALFHDLGKAMVLFQKKLKRAMKSSKHMVDAIRHEYISAAVWDHLFGEATDAEIIETLSSLSPGAIDAACIAVRQSILEHYQNPKQAIRFRFLSNPHGIAFAVGMLVLVHHRLPGAGSDHRTLDGTVHIDGSKPLTPNDLQVAPGKPFWHDDWWLTHLRHAAGRLSAGAKVHNLDMALRSALMLADHMGSAAAVASDVMPEHLANTRENKPADSLSRHVQRVYGNCKGAFDILHRYRGTFPSISKDQMPFDLLHPDTLSKRFGWQGIAAAKATELCSFRPGGFFGCILSGTGTGKTRGAPAILAAATLADTDDDRRGFRMILGLGLRSLAAQSGNDYVEQVGFDKHSIGVMIGREPIAFESQENISDEGSESLVSLPDWLVVRNAEGSIPQEGDESENNWLRGLSSDTDRSMPAFVDIMLQNERNGSSRGRKLLGSPVLVGTVDHVAGVASPARSSHLPGAVRIMTSDLVLDEIDQYSPEDIAVLGRLIYQSGAAGRRVIIMSATMTQDIATTLHECYRTGWSAFSSWSGCADNVNVLCTGDARDSCHTNADGRAFTEVFASSLDRTIASLSESEVLRKGEYLPACETWNELVEQIDHSCSRLHDINAVDIEGFKVSVGLVRMTRIRHTAAMAVQLPAGRVGDRLRLKVCLHSQFPRLHREWIEFKLKKALTRSGETPDKGVYDLCKAHGVFEMARVMGVDQIEIVVVASPVIETGNDLDFDYGIVDSMSVRSVVQVAGRIRRHRPASGKLNMLVIGRSPVAIKHGELSNPGVETPPHPDTGIEKSRLDAYPGRDAEALFGEANIEAIDSRFILDQNLYLPLRDAEASLLSRMISLEREMSPLAEYLGQAIGRLNKKFTQSRRFRRGPTRSFQYSLKGQEIETAEWHIDLAPGTRNSRPQIAQPKFMHPQKMVENNLFPEIKKDAWREYANSRTLEDVTLICMDVEIPDYQGDGDFPDPMAYSEFSGFTKGVFEDLFQPFGETQR